MMAMHLLQSTVDLNMIRSWLGYASIETTNNKLLPKKGKHDPPWQRDSDVLSWFVEALVMCSVLRTENKNLQSEQELGGNRSLIQD